MTLTVVVVLVAKTTEISANKNKSGVNLVLCFVVDVVTSLTDLGYFEDSCRRSQVSSGAFTCVHCHTIGINVVLCFILDIVTRHRDLG